MFIFHSYQKKVPLLFEEEGSFLFSKGRQFLANQVTSSFMFYLRSRECSKLLEILGSKSSCCTPLFHSGVPFPLSFNRKVGGVIRSKACLQFLNFLSSFLPSLKNIQLLQYCCQVRFTLTLLSLQIHRVVLSTVSEFFY